MTFLIITHVAHKPKDNLIYGYAPYIREMNLWLSYVDKVTLIAPLSEDAIHSLDAAYQHQKLKFIAVPAFDLTSFWNRLKMMFVIPVIFFNILRAMHQADHIHLRCPGNMGLLGAIVQILFPNKPKTAKYAGNWDPKSKQPISYRLQKWILSNTFLTKNMQVLIYGEWPNQSKNIKSFFTATYHESDKKTFIKRNFSETIKFLFVGTLSTGKRPIYALQLIKKLFDTGHKVSLDFYGEGVERKSLETFIADNNLNGILILNGNQTNATVQEAYQNSHFLVLPSKSEGWPKVVAEAMFWGCLPIASAVSCVPNMLDYGNRGIILEMNLENDFQQIVTILKNEEAYQSKVKNAADWSRKYTLDFFEAEIKLLLQS